MNAKKQNRKARENTMGSEIKKSFKLQSLNPQYPYMPREEWESRIEKARGLMEEKGLDAMIILTNQNRLYFFGSAKSYKYGYQKHRNRVAHQYWN